jgi:hypothetical protein
MAFPLLKLFSPKPPTLPSIPSLAELREHAEALKSSLPAYTASAPPVTGRPGLVDVSLKPKSTPIPRVNLPSKHSYPGAQAASKGADGWFANVTRGLAGGWVTSASPPPRYSPDIPSAQGQLSAEMARDLPGGRLGVGRDAGQQGDVDQAREGLKGMQRGWPAGAVVQGAIPGEGAVNGRKGGTKLVDGTYRWTGRSGVSGECTARVSGQSADQGRPAVDW